MCLYGFAISVQLATSFQATHNTQLLKKKTPRLVDTANQSSDRSIARQVLIVRFHVWAKQIQIQINSQKLAVALCLRCFRFCALMRSAGLKRVV